MKNGIYYVKDFGAVWDRKILDGQAIQKAIHECNTNELKAHLFHD